jgi:beta-galactosidase
MRLSASLLLLCLGWLPQPAAAEATEGRARHSLNAGWTFAIEDSGGRGVGEAAGRPIDLPHTWNAAAEQDKRSPYLRGVGNYRKTLYIEPSWAGKRLYLYFEGANQVTEVQVNGRHAGRHLGGYTAFALDISGLVSPGAENRVEIRVDNRHDPDIPPLDADFTFYGGIYRDLWLLVLDEVHFDLDEYGAVDFRIDPAVLSRTRAALRVNAGVRNASPSDREVRMNAKLLDAGGREVAQRSTTARIAAGALSRIELAGFDIPQPELWSPESPYLYRLVGTISEGGRILDRLEYPVGLRWFGFDAQQGLTLNGEPYRLNGTNRHQDHAGLGNALPDALHRADLRKIKEDGFNFLRLAHYPQDPAVLQAADELGLVVWEEIPIVNMIGLSDAFRDHATRMLREMIRQHRHHPSIAFWGYMNEVTLREPDPLPPGYYAAVAALAEELNAVAKTEDLARPTVMALSWDELNREADRQADLSSIPDILAFNLYFGWYYGELDSLGRFLDRYHRDFPGRPLMISEYGAGSDRRVHALDPEPFDFSTEYQQVYHEASFRQLAERPWLLGTAVWAQFDFGSQHRQDTRFGINQKGLRYFDREPKDIAWFYRAQLSAQAVVHIAARDWPQRAGSRPEDATMPLRVYSNAGSIELSHNGRSLGERPVRNATVVFEVTLEQGENFLVAKSPRGEDQLVIRYEDRSALFAADPTDVVLAVNAGAHEQFVDGNDRVWEADREYREGSWGYVGGAAGRSHHRIFDTDDDPLYQTRRTGSFSYRFDAPDGPYCFTGHVADFERDAGVPAGFRVTTGNASVAVSNFAPFTPRIVQQPVTATGGGGLVIGFSSGLTDAYLNGFTLQRGRCYAGAPE